MRRSGQWLQQSGLALLIVVICVVVGSLAGSHVDPGSGKTVSNFFNSSTLLLTATNASFFAVMAVGMTMVIISGGIDLSVGSIYALCGTSMALILRSSHVAGPGAIWTGLAICLAIGLVCGLINGVAICVLNVHPFIITLGTMWIYRGIAFVTSKAESILVPDSLTSFAKATFGLSKDLYPVPMLVMIAVMIAGTLYLRRTVAGRNVFAVGGNPEASRYSGIQIPKVLIAVYAISGICAAIAAYVGSGYYGAAACGDATGYELYVIASAVVGGASLVGGKGSALSAMLGAILIVLMRQSITTLHFSQEYEWIIIGVAIIVAVVLDRLNAKLAQKSLAGASKIA